MVYAMQWPCSDYSIAYCRCHYERPRVSGRALSWVAGKLPLRRAGETDRPGFRGAAQSAPAALPLTAEGSMPRRSKPDGIQLPREKLLAATSARMYKCTHSGLASF